MAKKAKLVGTDGFGPKERKSVDSAIRQVWYRSKARATAVKRCKDKQGFTRCEMCKKRTPSIKVDHITPCGPVDSDGFITRLFCPSALLQCLCHPCHKPKTKAEGAARAKGRAKPKPIGVKLDTPKKARNFTDDF